MSGDLEPAESAQPGKHRGLAPVARNPRHCLLEGSLDDVLRDLAIAADAAVGEAIQPRVVLVDEGVEGPLVAPEHPGDESPIVESLFVHAVSSKPPLAV